MIALMLSVHEPQKNLSGGTLKTGDTAQVHQSIARARLETRRYRTRPQARRGFKRIV